MKAVTREEHENLKGSSLSCIVIPFLGLYETLGCFSDIVGGLGERVFLKLVVRRPEGFDVVDDFFDLAGVRIDFATVSTPLEHCSSGSSNFHAPFW